MPDEDSKIHREKSLKVPFIIFFDLECLLEKINRLFKDYYKPIKTNSAFNGNYIEYRAMETKKNIYHQKNTLILKNFCKNIEKDLKK